MNIGFDGKRAANNLTGLGNYSRSLISQLSKFFHQNQYFVYTPKLSHSERIKSFFLAENIHLKLPGSKQNSIYWRSFAIKKQLKKDNIELFHGLSHEIPFGLKSTGIKSIVTIHDLIYRRLPQNYSFINRCIYNFKSKYACKNSNQIIAISQRTKQDIIEYYHIDEHKIEVIYQSCDDSFKQLLPQEAKEIIRTKYALPEQYILNVGTIEPRKNLMLIVKALKHINPLYKLVVVGKGRTYADRVKKEIKSSGLINNVIFIENIPFKELPAVYQMATVFIYPSFYEGFGIPIIEALYSHVPVVAATGSCLEEAGGPGSIYIDPNDSLALANSVNEVIDNPALQNSMKIQGLKYVQKFNNEPLAQKIMNCYLRTSKL